MACSDDSHELEAPSEEPSITVLFDYAASTTVDPDIDFVACADGVEFTSHIHFTWNNWKDRRYMTIAGPTHFQLSGPIPIDRRLQLALHDPNICLKGDVYVAPTTLRANGVLLTEVVRVTQGEGVSFSVDSDGIVTP